MFTNFIAGAYPPLLAFKQKLINIHQQLINTKLAQPQEIPGYMTLKFEDLLFSSAKFQ